LVFSSRDVKEKLKMAKEIFVIYNKNTGFIDGGTGKVDRVWDKANADGSTISERIPEIIAEGPDREVIYLPDQKLPSAEEHKIAKGKIVNLTLANKKTIEDNRPKDTIELLLEKIGELEARIVEMEKEQPI
jgi:hypothetical protein